MTTVINTNIYGGPFSELWEVQRWVVNHGYDPSEWDFTQSTLNAAYFDASEVKEKVDAGEYTVPCEGSCSLSEDNAETFSTYDEQLDSFEVVLDATCEDCGFTYTETTHLTPSH